MKCKKSFCVAHISSDLISGYKEKMKSLAESMDFGKNFWITGFPYLGLMFQNYNLRWRCQFTSKTTVVNL